MPVSPDQLRERWQQDAEQPEEESLPPLTTISIDVTGSRGKRYKGTFTFKVPTLGEQIEIGRLKAAYLPNGAAVDTNALLLTEQCCYLAVTLQKPVPSWWRPFEMYDAAPVSALYAEATNYEKRFHGAGTEPGRDQARAPAAEDGAGEPATAELDLGEDISPPPKRPAAVIAESSRSR